MFRRVVDEIRNFSFEKFVVIALALIVGLSAFTTVRVLTQATDRPYDPFGEFPVQSVVNGDRGPDGYVTVSLSDDAGVSVVGKKCIDSEEPVRVTGSSFWSFDDPPGTTIDKGDGSRLYTPGCVYFVEDFPNACPPGSLPASAGRVGNCERAFFNSFTATDGLIEEIQSYHDRGITPLISIKGEETPTAGGVTQTWETEKFFVSP